MTGDQLAQLAHHAVLAVITVSTVILTALGYRKTNGWEKRPHKRPAKRRKRKRAGNQPITRPPAPGV